MKITRIQGGQEGCLDNLSLHELRAGALSLFRNPFRCVPLSDEEIGIGQALLNMADFLRTGVSAYSLQDALTDVRLAFAVDEAIALGRTVTLEDEIGTVK